MKTIDRLGIGPTRNAIQDDDGNWIVTVTPPSWSGFKGSTLRLNPDQYRRYCWWRDNDSSLIQDALPDLSLSEREILISGICEADFRKLE